MAYPNLSDIVATTIAHYSRTAADNMEHNNALLYKLRQRGNSKTVSGGTHIIETILYDDGDTNYQASYSGYDALDTTPYSPISAAEFDFKQYSVPVSFSGMEQLQNAGKEQIIDMIAERTEAAYIRMRNIMSRDLYGNGTGNGGKNITGLAAAVSATPTSGTYGGIDRATWAFWRNQIVSASGDIGAALSPSTILQAMNRLALATARGTDRVDLIIADDVTFDYYQSALQAIQRVTSDSGSGMAGAGFTSLKYHGAGANADVIFDGGIGGNMPSNTMYFLNTNYIKFRPHAKRNFVPLGERTSINQDATVNHILWAGNLTCRGAMFNGILTA